MKHIRAALIALLSLLSLTPAIAQQFPLTMPANTVYGRLGTGTGPGQAIPFATLKSQLSVPTLPSVYASFFGVKCDGTVDEAPNIMRAVTAADALGGAEVVLPAGRCVVNSSIFLNKWVTAGILTVPGLRLRGAGKDVTLIDTRVTNGYAIGVNPDWRAIFQAQSLMTAGTSGTLPANTYYIQITANDGLGNEILVTAANPVTTSGSSGSIAIPVGKLAAGYSLNIYIGTTTSPGNYAIANGVLTSAIAGNQTITVTGIGTAHTVPGGKVAAWQTAAISDLSITNTVGTSAASGILFFKAGYSRVDNIYVKNLTGNGFDVPNYTGDLDGSFNVSVSNSKFDTIAGTCVNAAGTHLELSNFYVSDTIFNLCGTLPTNYVHAQNYSTSGFVISSITNSGTPVVTTAVAHTLANNDQVYIRGVTGMTLADGWYRVGLLSPTTYNLKDLNGSLIDTTSLGTYTANSGRSMLAWRPPTVTSNSGGLVWMGLIGTFRNLDFTQNSNFSMYFTEAGTSDNATIENVDFENTFGKGLYAAALTGGTLTNSECLTAISQGTTISCVQLGTGFNAGGVKNFQIRNSKVRVDSLIPQFTAFEQFQNTNNTSTFNNSVRVSGVLWQAFDAAGQRRFNGFDFNGIQGTARFSITSTNTAKLCPNGFGATMPMKLSFSGEWIEYRVPVSCVVATGLSGTPSTLYYFYLANSAVAAAPEVGAIVQSQTAPINTEAAGYATKADDPTRTFIGTATTDGSGNFQTSGAQSSQYGNSGTTITIGNPINGGGPNLVLYENASGNLSGAAAANNSVFVSNGSGVPGMSTTLPNVAHGTPTSITLTSGTGLPISTGLTGAGTGVLTALGINTGTSGAFVVNGGVLGVPSSGTLTNATGLPLSTGVTGTLAVGNGGTGTTSFTAHCVLTGQATSALGCVAGNSGNSSLPLISQGASLEPVYGTLSVGGGGTGQNSALSARSAAGLNLEANTPHGDSNYTILVTDRTVSTNASFTASRTWTLPAANAVNAGTRIIVADMAGGVTASNTLVISRAGSDTINGGTSVTINGANGGYMMISDGSTKWSAQPLGPVGVAGVTSVGGVGGAISLSSTDLAMSGSTLQLSAARKALSIGCAISATATTTCLDGSAGANNGTFTTSANCGANCWLEVEMIGGGGGGAGSGTTPGNGIAGGNTTFGGFTAGGASAGVGNGGGAGGTASSGYAPYAGGSGSNGSGLTSTQGGFGCASPYGGAGAGGAPGAGAGVAAANNSGSGGGGGGVNTTVNGGGGGGCGGAVRAIVQNPGASATISYAIGAGGGGGAAGTGGAAGGAGGSGRIMIITHFN